jgi:RNA polymerase sigma-70 factor, ECF subfamily
VAMAPKSKRSRRGTLARCRPIFDASVRTTRVAALSGSLSPTAPGFEHVYRGNAAFVRGVLQRFGLTMAALDDALQDVFVVVYRRLSDFDSSHPLRSWLYSIARRVASHHRRTLRRRSGQELLEQTLVDMSPSPLELTERRESVAQLSVLLASLEPDKRKLVVLADLEERSVPEIAQLTGENMRTIYTRLRRARMALHASAGARFTEVNACES